MKAIYDIVFSQLHLSPPRALLSTAVYGARCCSCFQCHLTFVCNKASYCFCPLCAPQHMVDKGVLVHASGDKAVRFDVGFFLFCINSIGRTPESSLSSTGICVCAYVFVECMRLCVHVHVFAHVLLGYHAMPNV